MTGENQAPVTPDQGTPQFGSDNGTNAAGGSFGTDDVQKILSQNRHAQDHIKTLESETAAMRAELQALRDELAKAKSIDDLLATMQQTNEPGPTAPTLDQEQLLTRLKSEVFRDLSVAQQQSLELQNWNESVSTLRQRHGDGYAKYVDQRAAELGIPVPKMEELAKTSPKAFLELVSPGKTGTAAPTTGSYTQPVNADKEAESMFIKISTLRLRNTPEGREAKRQWDDPDFQRRYRLWVLNRAKTNGSSFGNNI
jgi:outer membrane murein-binding lipoprotein Lpp